MITKYRNLIAKYTSVTHVGIEGNKMTDKQAKEVNEERLHTTAHFTTKTTYDRLLL